MSRGHTGRVATVWLAVTALFGTATAWLAPDLAALGRGVAGPGGFAELLVPVCAAVALGCAGWFWIVTSITTVEVLRGTPAQALAARGPTRRAVLVLCGLAVATQLAGPAAAVGSADGSARPTRPAGEAVLAGLSLPERAVARSAPSARHAAPPGTARESRRGPERSVVVQAGDSLWTIAEAALGPDATEAEVSARWHAIYDANHRVVGDDPDLIHPGQRLDLPDDPEEHR